MAFPVPEHLPRKPIPTDVSSQISSKISDVTNKSLTAGLAAEWISELETSIEQTRDRIYERINEELPDFERQLESSRSVQTRLRDLSSNLDRLTETLEDPRTGLLPVLLSSLKSHRELAQRASDAQVTFEALSYLNECRAQFESLTSLVRDGNLTEGVAQATSLATLLDNAPEALAKADVMTDMKNQLRTLKDRTEEQLSEAYSRSIRISSTELRIAPSVKVRQSPTIISLQDILSSLSSTSLDSHLASLRRDIVAHFIDVPLKQPSSSNISRTSDVDGAPSIRFSIFPLPPSPTSRNSTPAYLRSLFDFLREQLFPALPPPASSSFPQLLYKPTTSALLRDVIVPSLPSSLAGLPSFLDLVQDATRFEQGYFFKSNASVDNLHGEGEILAWARGVAGHYGRKRRIDLLAEARKVVLSSEDGRTARVEIAPMSDMNVTLNVPEVIPVQGDIDGGKEAESGWDFDDGAPAVDANASTNGKQAEEVNVRKANEASGGDFDGANAGTSKKTKVEDDAQDDSDAWGWGDEEETSTPATSENGNPTKPSEPANGHKDYEPRAQENFLEESAWDTTWDEPEPVPPSLPVEPVSPAKVPKVAKRLEKLTAKGKGKGPTSPAPSSNPPSSTFSASSTLPSSISSVSQSFSSPRSQVSSTTTSPIQSNQQAYSSLQDKSLKPPALSLPQKPKEPETYLISGRVQDLIRLISDILSEGRAIADSPVFSDFPLSSPDSAGSASTLVLQAAPAALDLYHAIYPIAFAGELSRPSRALRFANDCIYLHKEVAKLELPPSTAVAVHGQMCEALERLHALGAWWSDEGIERECVRVLQILSRAEGFVETGNQEQFDECEAVMCDALRDVRTATGEWKTILPRTKWLRAAGRVVETALARVLDDILALPDIPELDSRRLAELCRILNALEGLFVDAEDPEAPSMVSDYVPSWFKYSYLSELLEASIVDVSYLFDEGALIDFTVDELVRLARALFADTPMRTNAIAKLQRGHPVPVE